MSSSSNDKYGNMSVDEMQYLIQYGDGDDPDDSEHEGKPFIHCKVS